MNPTQHAAEALALTVSAKATNNTELCVTFSDPAAPEERWIQVTWNQFNASYPHRDPPAQRFSLPDSIKAIAWEPGLYATFSHSGGMDAVVFLAGYTEHTLGSPLDDRWSREVITL